MSEYQYYEWQTIDRPLTGAERREVNELSSHMDVVTSTQAVVTYSWGDFKHDPEKVLLKYFDAFLYDSNFGSRRLMFRLPRAAVDMDAIGAYELEDWVRLDGHGNYFVLEISFSTDSGDYEWVESDDVLGQLTGLREQVLQGDYRMLYLIWLKAMENNPDAFDEDDGPPIPAGLKDLNAGLQTFVDFFGINPHLIAAAAASSHKVESAQEPVFETAIAKLTRAEADDFLSQIVRGEPGAVVLLKKRLLALTGGQPAQRSATKVTADELFQRAEKLEKEEKRKAQEEAEKRRIQRLEKLAKEEDAAWVKAEDLLSQKKASAYDEATKLLVELKELSVYQKQVQEFQDHFQYICQKYGKSVALLDRFYRVGLLKK